MFTQSTIEALKTYFKLAILFKAEPFEWINSPILGKLQVTNSKFKWLLLALSFSWVVARSMWMVPNFIWQIMEGAPVKTSVINFIRALFHIVVVVFQVSTFWHREEIKGFINCLLHYNQYAPEYFLGTKYPLKKDGCEKVLRTFTFISFSNSLGITVLLFGRDWMNYRYFYWMLVGAYDCPWLRFLWGCLEFWTEWMMCFPWLMTLYLIWIYTKSSKFWLQQIRFGANERICENPKNVISIFQRLQILNVQFNSCFSNVTVPVFLAFNIIMHSSMNVLTLKFHGVLPAQVHKMFSCWTVIWLYVQARLFTMLGNVNYYSQGFVKSWVDVVGVKSRKKLKSMHPVGIKLGSIYVIRKTTVLSVFLLVVNITVQALLMM